MDTWFNCHFKKETDIFIYHFTVNINKVHWINIVVGGCHGQGTFRVPTKLIYVMHDVKICEYVVHVDYMYCKKINGTILKYTLIMKLWELLNTVLYPFSFNNQHIPIPNVYVSGNIAFCHSYGKQTFFCKMTY